MTCMHKVILFSQLRISSQHGYIPGCNVGIK